MAVASACQNPGGDVTGLRRPVKKARERRRPEGAEQLTSFPATRLCLWLSQQFVLSLPDPWVLAMPSLLSTPKLVPVIARLRGLSG